LQRQDGALLENASVGTGVARRAAPYKFSAIVRKSLEQHCYVQVMRFIDIKEYNYILTNAAVNLEIDSAPMYITTATTQSKKTDRLRFFVFFPEKLGRCFRLLDLGHGGRVFSPPISHFARRWPWNPKTETSHCGVRILKARGPKSACKHARALLTPGRFRFKSIHDGSCTLHRYATNSTHIF
jgi:hypothetical protein